MNKDTLSHPMRIFAALMIFCLVASAPGGGLHAQSAEGDDNPSVYRFGLALGGAAGASIVFEYESGNRAIEVALGSHFRHDVALAVVGKLYVGGGDLRGFAGAGFRGVAVLPPDNRISVFQLQRRIPVGVDWHVGERHAIGIERYFFHRTLASRPPMIYDPERIEEARRAIERVEVTPTRVFSPGGSLYYRFADPR